MVVVMPEPIKELGYDKAEDVTVTMSDEIKKEAVQSILNDRFGDIIEAQPITPNGTVETLKKVVSILLDTIAYVIYGVSAVFAAVIVIFVTKIMFLRERTDIGIYKSLGLTSGLMRTQFAVRFLLAGIVGSLLGAVLSLLFTQKMLGIMLTAAGITGFDAQFTAGTFLVPSVFICAGAFLCSYLASYRVKKVEVRELITE